RLLATLARAGIVWSEDPMNADPAFARARLRAAGAVLAREGLTPERMARLAERMARYQEAVAAAVETARIRLADPQRTGRFDGRALAALPEEVALRLLAGEIAAVPGCTAAKPPRLHRREALWRDLREAIAGGRATKRTLGEALVTVDRQQGVLITPAAPRRAPARTAAASRGRRNRAKHPFTKTR